MTKRQRQVTEWALDKAADDLDDQPYTGQALEPPVDAEEVRDAMKAALSGGSRPMIRDLPPGPRTVWYCAIFCAINFGSLLAVCNILALPPDREVFRWTPVVLMVAFFMIGRWSREEARV